MAERKYITDEELSEALSAKQKFLLNNINIVMKEAESAKRKGEMLYTYCQHIEGNFNDLREVDLASQRGLKNRIQALEKQEKTNSTKLQRRLERLQIIVLCLIVFDIGILAIIVIIRLYS